MLPSALIGMEASGGNRLALLNGVLYATSGGWLGEADSTPPDLIAALVKVDNGQVSEVADTWDLEKSQNPDGLILESHPYGLAAGPDGALWITDAAGNSLLKANPDTGQLEVVATFAGVPSPLPNDLRGGALESDPVPTGVTFDSAGNAYVSFLPGVPFLPGSAKVVKVTPTGQVSDYATGLTTITDIRTGPDGNLYAVQFAQFSEQGPAPDSGAIIRVKEGSNSEVVVDGLSFPTSIDFNANGDAYVTINGVGAPGSGEVVMFAQLTGQAGTPLTGAAPAALPVSGGAEPTTKWATTLLLVLGLVLMITGYWLKRRRIAA